MMNTSTNKQLKEYNKLARYTDEIIDLKKMVNRLERKLTRRDHKIKDLKRDIENYELEDELCNRIKPRSEQTNLTS